MMRCSRFRSQIDVLGKHLPPDDTCLPRGVVLDFCDLPWGGKQRVEASLPLGGIIAASQTPRRRPVQCPLDPAA